MSHSFPKSSSWANLHLKAMSKTDKYRSRGRPSVGGTKTGGEMRNSLIFSKACWQSSFQTIVWFFLIIWKIGSHMSINLVMKQLIYCNLPIKPLTSLSVLGAGMSSMTMIFSGSTSIPRLLTICPSSFPEVTPNVNFLGFNRSLNCLILSKNLYKATR